MGLIYCGIDEAGYGPMLGPLTVGFAALRLDGWTPDDGAPDMWKMLASSVCRAGGDKRGRIAVADSKKLKLSNQLKSKHPLTHLERGVLAFAGLVNQEPAAQAMSRLSTEGGACVPQVGEQPDPVADKPDGARKARFGCDASLFDALGVRLEPHEWYGGDPIGLPLACSIAQLAIARNKLGLSLGEAGVECVALACTAVGEREFNEVVRTGGSKAHVTSRCFARYLRRVVERWGSGVDEVRVVCDRHGGRTGYSEMIESAVRGVGYAVGVLEESDRCSRYRVGDRVTVQFRPEAEDAHLPVALASMTAKLVRELAMARFNRYWCARMPELKPTAGYVQDARRWLADCAPGLTVDQRASLVRQA